MLYPYNLPRNAYVPIIYLESILPR